MLTRAAILLLAATAVMAMDKGKPKTTFNTDAVLNFIKGKDVSVEDYDVDPRVPVKDCSADAVVGIPCKRRAQISKSQLAFTKSNFHLTEFWVCEEAQKGTDFQIMGHAVLSRHSKCVQGKAKFTGIVEGYRRVHNVGYLKEHRFSDFIQALALKDESKAAKYFDAYRAVQKILDQRKLALQLPSKSTTMTTPSFGEQAVGMDFETSATSSNSLPPFPGAPSSQPSLATPHTGGVPVVPSSSSAPTPVQKPFNILMGHTPENQGAGVPALGSSSSPGKPLPSRPAPLKPLPATPGSQVPVSGSVAQLNGKRQAMMLQPGEKPAFSEDGDAV